MDRADKIFFSRITGRMMKDCTIEGQYIDENGSAELTTKELLDQKVDGKCTQKDSN